MKVELQWAKPKGAGLTKNKVLAPLDGRSRYDETAPFGPLKKLIVLLVWRILKDQPHSDFKSDWSERLPSVL